MLDEERIRERLCVVLHVFYFIPFPSVVPFICFFLKWKGQRKRNTIFIFFFCFLLFNSMSSRRLFPPFLSLGSKEFKREPKNESKGLGKKTSQQMTELKDRKQEYRLCHGDWRFGWIRFLFLESNGQSHRHNHQGQRNNYKWWTRSLFPYTFTVFFPLVFPFLFLYYLIVYLLLFILITQSGNRDYNNYQ